MDEIEAKQLLVKVDHLDRVIGVVEKKEAHLKGILHRAFSIFIFRKVGSSTQLLLQKRASMKYHSGGLWTNTCCGHAEPDLPVAQVVGSRLQNEMGFSCPLESIGSFYYRAVLDKGMVEHEIDHVFAAFCNPSKIIVNPREVEGFEWIDLEDLQQILNVQQQGFTVWFPGAFHLALNYVQRQEARKGSMDAEPPRNSSVLLGHR